MTATVHAAGVVLTMTGEPIRDGAVLVEGALVADVGPRDDVVRRAGAAARVREWPGVLTPGLVNAHTHLEYGPSFADLATAGLPFAQWSAQVEARRQALSVDDWQVEARGSVHAALRTGTTCVGDVVTHGQGTAAAARVGLAGTSHVEGIGAPPPALHSPCGLLGPGVAGGSADSALSRRTAVVLCTRSDALLQADEAPVADHLGGGSPVAIGTESLASCPDLDLLAEARACRDLAARQGLDGTSAALLAALTTGGAAALGVAAGTIAPGARADLAVFDVPVVAGDLAGIAEVLIGEGPGRCTATVLAGRLVHRRA